MVFHDIQSDSKHQNNIMDKAVASHAQKYVVDEI